MSHFVELETRGVVALTGPDRAAFLNGLTTNEVPAPGAPPVYSAVLTPQGKFLFDFFIIATDAALLLDCAKAQAAALIARLRPYKLRAQVELSESSDAYAVIAVTAPLQGSFPATHVYADPRHAELGTRLLVPRDWVPDVKARLLATGLVEGTTDDYDIHRLRLGVPEGATDIPSGQGLPLEYNLDLFHAISWTKGCYVGQELTARTRYRALLKKRLFAVSSTAPLPAAGTPVLQGGAEAGEIRAATGNDALALLRFDNLAQEEVLTADGKPLTVTWPQGLDRTSQTGSTSK